LVLASNFETFGIPALEALAAGVPVVCTRCYGPETFLDSACAEMCEFENPEDLARAIKAMYERKGTFDEDALRAVAKNFGSEAIANRAFALYEELLQK
jgi:glycosyltransferase involved in cell wall biosynthesis